MKTANFSKIIFLLVVTCTTAPTPAQQSNEEVAFAAVSAAKNAAAALAAAEDFVARFPNSIRRAEVAEHVATQITTVRNPTVAASLIDRARVIFVSPLELKAIKPIILEALANAGRADEAFPIAAELLNEKPDETWILLKMTFLGAQEARKRNNKYVEVSLEYGMRAADMLEKDKKPARLADEMWLEQKKGLPRLYQHISILRLAQGDNEQAKININKAISLAPRDPTHYALLGRILNAEYQKSLNAFNELSASPEKENEKRKVDAQLDQIIEAYARAAGLAAGKMEYENLLQQVIPDLTTYYKMRNNESAVGLKQLILKYR